MLPVAGCPPCEPCCAGLYGYANQLLEIAQLGLAECVECCGEIPGFVTVGPFVTRPSGDYLAVWLSDLRPSGRTDRRGGLLSSLALATFSIKLMEGGWPWPMANEGTIELAPPDVVNEAAKHSTAHAEAIVRQVIDAAMTGQFGCGYKGWVPLTPVQPQGGMAGWTTGIIVDVEW